MKKILSFFMVFLLAALFVVPCFAAETTAAPLDPVDWFGGQGAMDSYSVSYSGTLVVTEPSASPTRTNLCNWLVSVGATSVSTAIGSCTGLRYDYGTEVSGSLWGIVDNGIYRVFIVYDGNSSAALGTMYSFDADIPSTAGYDDYSSFLTSSGFVLTPGYSSGGGFVDSGVSDALTELSLIVSAILSNQYILIAIGLAVAVPLVAWGISKLKSLVKGY